MIDSLCLLALVSLIALSVSQGKTSFLPILVTLEFTINQFINSLLNYIDLYTVDNLSTIILCRFIISGITASIILRHRQQLDWVTIGVLYVVALLFQFATFVEISLSSGILIGNYPIVIQSLNVLIVLTLVINNFGINHRLRSLFSSCYAFIPTVIRHSKRDGQ